MPKFYGTLRLDDTHRSGLTPKTLTTKESNEAGQQYESALSSIEESHLNKPINSDVAIVLANLLYGFTKPNIIDIKLGRRLWDFDASAEVRQRRDLVSESTTCKSLAFKISGMKIYSEADYSARSKAELRTLTDVTTCDAFREYFDIQAGQFGFEDFVVLCPSIIAAIDHIEKTVRQHETRIYSSSILLVYEGDPDARKVAIETLRTNTQIDTKGDEDDVDDDSASSEDDEEDMAKAFEVRLIDFAHARWLPGEGPDDNMLEGLLSVINIFKDLLREVEKR